MATGAVAAFAKAPHAFRSEQARALQTLTEEVAPGITNARRFARAEQRAVTDELTGVPKRKDYEAELAREVARAGRTGRPLSLLVLDLDATIETTAPSDAPESELGLRELAANTFTHGAPTMVSARLVDWRPNETSESLDARVLSAATRLSGDVSELRTAPTGQRRERARERVGDTEPDTGDPQSRLGTRRTFLDRLAHEVARAHRDAGQLALLVLDVSVHSLSERLGEVGANRVFADLANGSARASLTAA